jgi:hypothetical protein
LEIRAWDLFGIWNLELGISNGPFKHYPFSSNEADIRAKSLSDLGRPLQKALQAW